MKKKDWNPELYLRFEKERVLPSVDLVSRIDLDYPASIIDIGCGPGNSTQILHQRWPESRILGIDNSNAMIERAKLDYPELEWKLLDAGKDVINGKYDVVFSNATIQWIPDHASLFKRFREILTHKGVMAVQLPLFFEMPLGRSIAELSGSPRWNHKVGKVNQLFTIHTPSAYYDMLSGLFRSVEIWETDYFHIMDSHHSIHDMIRATGLRPYLDRLESEEERQTFELAVLNAIISDYPAQKSGMVLFPFKRLFLIAGNS